MNSRDILAATAGALIVAAFATNANADCQLTIQPAQDQWLAPHDAFADDTIQRQFDVALINGGDSACRGKLGIDLRSETFGLTRPGDPYRVPYVLIDERGNSDVTPRAGHSPRRPNGRPINLAPGERELVRFTFAADASQTLGAGVYSQTAFLTIEANDGSPLAERPISLAIDVVSAAVMGLKGQFKREDGVARIDLGELSSGPKALDTSLFVLSTGGYRVSVESSNQGRLRLGLSDWFINYSLAIGSTAINLATGDDFEVVSNQPRTDNYPLSVNVGDVRGKRAGDYSDVLTFVIAAL